MRKGSDLAVRDTPYPHIPPLRLSPDAQLRAGLVAARVHVSSKPSMKPVASFPGYPVRFMSPNMLASVAYDLYMQGELEREEYLLLGFLSETHPFYNRTVGALTGEPARPDCPRDLIQEWEDHLQQVSASKLPLTVMLRRAKKILGLLRWLEMPSLGKCCV